MLVAARFNELKGVPEHRTEAFCIVADDGQAAATFRAVRRKRGDNCMAAGLNRLAHAGDVCRAVMFLREEVKGRPVVPEVIYLVRKGLSRGRSRRREHRRPA